MGKDEAWLLEQAKRQKVDAPRRIMEAPDLLPGLDFYYYAFKRLSPSRALGQGVVGAIPYEAKSQFCKDEDIEGDEKIDFFYHIESLDAAYIEWQADKIQRDIKAGVSRPRSRRK